MSGVIFTKAAQSAPARFGRLVDGLWLDWVIGALFVLATFSTSLQLLRGGTALPESLRLLVSTACALALLAAVVLLSGEKGRRLACFLASFGRIPVWGAVLLGIALRLVWVLTFPADAGSDGAVYLSLAAKLIDGLPYEVDGYRAYWPVGYPLYLAGWTALIDIRPLNYLASNFFQFIVGCVGVAYLGHQIAGVTAARIAATLFALWPNLVFSSATPEKEMLVLAILPWATALIFKVVRYKGGYLLALMAGLLLGGAILVQPSLQFLPWVGALLIIGMCSGDIRFRTGRALILVFGVIIAVAPWSLRNFEVFDRFVLVSTNGGSNLYRANNPLATGGYVEKGVQDLSGLPELEQDRLGRQLAVEWIRSNPGAFLALVFEKQVRFMGDDAVGVYTTLKVGGASDDGQLYTALKLSANAWWVAAWALLSVMVLIARKNGTEVAKLGRATIWLWLYLFVLHSIFESAGKYHVPVLWVLCVQIAVFTTALKERRYK